MAKKRLIGMMAGIIGVILVAAGICLAAKHNASLGLIGGADGPTAIIVSRGISDFWYIYLAGTVVLLTAILLLLRKKK
ncbi:MAG: sodium ion-translocating decarboxylase subunit beta [Ruminococcaceae bacterium]|nr:sodium ion-translocating decarboxylase subunit beta [Oscillospiraceae bacterium]